MKTYRPIHECAPRSDIARATAVVFTQQGPGGGWHHQLSVGDAFCMVAIAYCPFCGVWLGREHFRGA